MKRYWLGFVLVMATAALFHMHAAVNWTASEPVGLYWRTADNPLVQICLPPDVEAHAIAQGLPARKGVCPSGYEPLLKQIYTATPSRPISFAESGFTVDGRLLPNTAPLAYSSAGKKLDHMDFRTYTSGTFAISSRHPHSYDSRYFGPIQTENIVAYSIPLVVFH